MSKKTILLVEDDEADARLVKGAFRSFPFEYKLEIAKNGFDALRILEQNLVNNLLPDLILLDLHMPKMNGFELLKEIRAREKLKDVRIVALTGVDSDEALLQAYNSGATSYAIKPMSRLEFKHFVAEMAEWWAMQPA